MFLDSGSDGQDVRIENDVLRRKANLFGENPIRARANLQTAVGRIGLALFIECHHDNGSAIMPDFPRLLFENLFAFLEAD